MTFWGIINPQKGREAEAAGHPALLDMSKGEMFLASCANILRNQYGFTRSADEGMAMDAKGEYLPLYTYPAIEYLTQFDYTDKAVFEWGAGASTFFWMRRAKTLRSIESTADWYRKLQGRMSANVSLELVEDDQFPFIIDSTEDSYDVIVVDGAGYRYDCAERAVAHLKPGGMIILDNADWHHNTAAYLKGQGLLQVDMAGFKPTESHTSTTSLFLDRAFDFPTVAERQPAFAMGAKQIHSGEWDRPYAKRR